MLCHYAVFRMGPKCQLSLVPQFRDPLLPFLRLKLQDGGGIAKDFGGANCFLSILFTDLPVVSLIFPTPCRSIWCH